VFLPWAREIQCDSSRRPAGRRFLNYSPLLPCYLSEALIFQRVEAKCFSTTVGPETSTKSGIGVLPFIFAFPVPSAAGCPSCCHDRTACAPPSLLPRARDDKVVLSFVLRCLLVPPFLFPSPTALRASCSIILRLLICWPPTYPTERGTFPRFSHYFFS